MGFEIERKYLVTGSFELDVVKSLTIAQGFLNTDPDRTVRVRIRGNQGFLTVKGRSNEAGTTRYEWEKEIPLAEAEELLDLCEPTVIEKTRHLVPKGNLVFEIDEFHLHNDGLLIAEVELPDEDYEFEKPEWLGEEVTGQVQYYNSMLSKTPFSKW